MRDIKIEFESGNGQPRSFSLSPLDAAKRFIEYALTSPPSLPNWKPTAEQPYHGQEAPLGYLKVLYRTAPGDMALTCPSFWFAVHGKEEQYLVLRWQYAEELSGEPPVRGGWIYCHRKDPNGLFTPIPTSVLEYYNYGQGHLWAHQSGQVEVLEGKEPNLSWQGILWDPYRMLALTELNRIFRKGETSPLTMLLSHPDPVWRGCAAELRFWLGETLAALKQPDYRQDKREKCQSKLEKLLATEPDAYLHAMTQGAQPYAAVAVRLRKMVETVRRRLAAEGL